LSGGPRDQKRLEQEFRRLGEIKEARLKQEFRRAGGQEAHDGRESLLIS
jgi:hypothetical protein